MIPIDLLDAPPVEQLCGPKVLRVMAAPKHGAGRAGRRQAHGLLVVEQATSAAV
ncbi:MAG TPA: hypothetical protein VGJ13_03470 [Pseudonocardiaceae bacterium]